MAPRLWRPAARPGPRPGVLQPLASRHHAPHRRHDPRMRPPLRHAPPLVTRSARQRPYPRTGSERSGWTLRACLQPGCEPSPRVGSEPEHGAFPVLRVADGDVRVLVADLDAVTTV